MYKRISTFVLGLAVAAVALVGTASAAEPTMQHMQDQSVYANFVGTDPATGVKTIISLDASATVMDGMPSSSGGVSVCQIDTTAGEVVLEANGWVDGLGPAGAARCTTR